MNCPCQSTKIYEDCCEPILKGAVKAPTAETLMRARYTAYVEKNMAFIENSHDPKTRRNNDMEANTAWAQKTSWSGLSILNVEKGGPEDSSGIVEFQAH